MEIQNLMSASIIVGAATGASAPEKNAESSAVDSASGQQSALSAKAPETKSLVMDANAAAQKEEEKKNGKEDEKNKLDEDSVSMLTKELNELMSQINCDLEFKYNNEVDVMTVKMVDKKTNEVLKEYPPEEMVENMIKAREWLGAFLDRQA